MPNLGSTTKTDKIIPRTISDLQNTKARHPALGFPGHESRRQKPLVCRNSVVTAPNDMKAHPDFDVPWIRKLLDSPDVVSWTDHVMDEHKAGNTLSNTLFETMLCSDQVIRAHLSLSRPSEEPDAIRGAESCMLLSIGDALDGATGRLHGGFNSFVLDQTSSLYAYRAKPDPNPPATAMITTDFKAPINTPCVVLCRAWLIGVSGRKLWVKAIIADKDGKLYASSKSLWVARTASLSGPTWACNPRYSIGSMSSRALPLKWLYPGH